MAGTGKEAGEATPLLAKDQDEANNSRVSFVRRSVTLQKANRPATTTDDRSSVRGFGALVSSSGMAMADNRIEPIDALASLVAGGVIVSTTGYKTTPRPPSVVKSLPAFAPFRRKARHRSFYLWWINEFRHWWKSSRLLVRLAGLFTLASTAIFIEKMVRVVPYAQKHKKIAKNSYRALRVVKKLGRGGPMKMFLKDVHPFTRSLRILVGAWRWIESAQCRRGEVGTEEAMAFIGNRVSRMLARTFVDLLILELVMPVSGFLFKSHLLPDDAWHPIVLFVICGILRACAPYAASFQGSRVGRALTRSFFQAYKHRWQPIQNVKNLNLKSDDCCEIDEISQTADLARLGRLVANALGKAQQIGMDGLKGQRDALAEEGFLQIGAGSGGYSVYQCNRRVWSRDTSEEGMLMTILLHVTPYGPSILDVLPRYVVLEFEDSVDRRNSWSEFLSKSAFEGPPVVEGYCYNGAFFSPHHFAEMKEMYDKQLLAYDNACKAMCKPRTGRSPNPPSDLLSLKSFLVEGKKGRKQKQNKREGDQLQAEVDKVAKELKAMMSGVNCDAPRGVILYFEGLDCAGKSSTGGLVEQALARAGYNVDMRQYNRPPTADQKRRPWIGRFEVPETSVAIAVKKGDDDGGKTLALLKKRADHDHNAMVWDRGPAGDFVYNPSFRKMEGEARSEKYREFMAFDRECFEKKILFLKLLFVTNRDSIAATLGKRLAQKHMARDLRTWLQASRGEESSYGEVGFEGLDAIEMHIDPTDFIAFNSYQENLRIFTNFAINTASAENPWVVVNTGDRYNARKHLLRAFKKKLERFKTRNGCCPRRDVTQEAHDTPALSEAEMLESGYKKPLPLQLVIALVGMLLIVFYYCEHTTFGTNIRDSFVWAGGSVANVTGEL